MTSCHTSSPAGGKRERGETPAQTAAREAEEETHGLLPREVLAPALHAAPSTWHPQGRYLLYLLEAPWQQAWGLPEEMEARRAGGWAGLGTGAVLSFRHGGMWWLVIGP